jgi:molecular chaperone IbpA
MSRNQLAFLVNPSLAFGAEFMARQIESARSGLRAFPYPPTDIIMHGDNDFEIQMALAGYDEADIDVTVRGAELRISGKAAQQPEGAQYYVKGISRKDFSRAFEFAHPVEVDAQFKQGMLIIKAKAVVPEAEKPRSIKIQA